MGFHRRTVPTYFGGLPGTYDYINNAVSGTPAAADGAKGSGPNAGSYFVAFGEDATSSNTNRANDALAENCDLLDDLFRTSQPVARYTETVTGGVVSTIVITGDIYVGGSAETPAVVNDQYTRDGLVRITDDENNELAINGSIVTTTLIHDGGSVNQVGTPAGGFYTNPSVNISPSIPTGVTYRIHYLVRRSMSDLIPNKPGEYLTNQMRVMPKIPATLHWGGLNERYNRASAYDATPPAAHPILTSTRDIAGDGGWFKKAGYPVMGYFEGTGSPSGTFDNEDYYMGAAFAAMSTINYGVPSAATERHSKGSGFVFRGNDRSNVLGSRTPALFPFAYMINRGGVTNVNDHTRLVAAGTATINVDQITLTGSDYFWQNISGQDRIGFVRGTDILVMKETSTGELSYFTLTAFASSTVATARYLDGSEPNISGPAAFTIVEWLAPSFFVSDGSTKWADTVGLASDLPDYAGFTFAEPPIVRDGGSYGSTYRRYVRLFGPEQEATTRVLGWGGHNQVDPTGAGGLYEEISWLYADGGGQINSILEANGAATGSAANDQLPALRTTVAPSNAKLLWEAESTSAGAKNRIYVTAGFVFTWNAEWTGAGFVYDVSAGAMMISFGTDGTVKREEAASGIGGNPITWLPEHNLTKYTAEDRQYGFGGTVDTTYFTMPSSTADVVLNDGADLELSFTSVKVGDIIRVWFQTDFEFGAQEIVVRLSFDEASAPATYASIPGAIARLDATQHLSLIGQYTCAGTDETQVDIAVRASNVVADNTNLFQGGWSLMAELIRPE